MRKQKNHSRIYKIDGVGVNLERFHPVSSVLEKNELREKYGFSSDDFILIYTAEFIPRKNHKLLFDILPVLKQKIPELKVVLCGKGELLEHYKDVAVQNKMDYVTFTGYTKEVDIYCRIADVCISTSLQEGQGLNLVEGMASGLPLVASSIRGHNDVIGQFENGFRFDLHRQETLIDAIILLYKNPALREEMGARNVEEAKKYSMSIAVNHMAEIYDSLIGYCEKSAGGGTTVE